MMIDTHAHLTSSDIYLDVEAFLKRAQDANVQKILNIATDFDSLEKGLALSKKHPWIFNAAAVHPHDALREQSLFYSAIQNNITDLKAIGETGLDYFYDNSPRKEQKQSLITYLELAQVTKLPVIIHCREAFEDFFSILNDFKEVKGVLHCFTGNQEEAKKVIDAGFYLSLSGIVTFKKSVDLQNIAKWMPIDRLLIETDAPYLAPQSKRGKPNESAYVAETAKFLANLRNEAFEDFVNKTTNNAEKLFCL